MSGLSALANGGSQAQHTQISSAPPPPPPSSKKGKPKPEGRTSPIVCSPAPIPPHHPGPLNLGLPQQRSAALFTFGSGNTLASSTSSSSSSVAPSPFPASAFASLPNPAPLTSSSQLSTSANKNHAAMSRGPLASAAAEAAAPHGGAGTQLMLRPRGALESGKSKTAESTKAKKEKLKEEEEKAQLQAVGEWEPFSEEGLAKYAEANAELKRLKEEKKRWAAIKKHWDKRAYRAVRQRPEGEIQVAGAGHWRFRVAERAGRPSVQNLRPGLGNWLLQQPGLCRDKKHAAILSKEAADAAVAGVPPVRTRRLQCIKGKQRGSNGPEKSEDELTAESLKQMDQLVMRQSQKRAREEAASHQAKYGKRRSFESGVHSRNGEGGGGSPALDELSLDSDPDNQDLDEAEDL